MLNTVSHKKSNFMFTLIQIIVWIFGLSIVAYHFLNDTFFTYKIKEGEPLCSSLLHCFLTIMSYGPRSSGSIGDVVLYPSYEKSNRDYYYSRYFFDIIAFYLINIIGINLILALIIENFASNFIRP